MERRLQQRLEVCLCTLILYLIYDINGCNVLILGKDVAESKLYMFEAVPRLDNAMVNLSHLFTVFFFLFPLSFFSY